MNYIQQITYALDKDIETIAFLSYFTGEKLEKKLALVRQQIGTAEKNKQIDALELLKIWEGQILEAQVLKKDLEIEDNPKLDMQLHLPELEAYEMIEKRQELMKQKLLNKRLAEKESHTET